VERGTTVAVVGESGSGKSTLARALTGLLPPLEGHAELTGEALPPALKQRSREQLRRLQMIYQMPDVSINPRQKIDEIIGRPLTFYFGIRGQERRKRVEELLAQVELEADNADRLPSALSGGMKQRIGIARALAAQPEVIICDEVTSALDQVVADDVLRLLLRIQKETQTSCIFITHDLATVRAIADSVAVMYQGEVVEAGPKDEVLNNPQTAYTQLLLSSVPVMKTGWLDGVLEERERRRARGEKVLQSSGQ
jgi:peptide/nickel transport system ATP-binding protein